MNTNHVPTASGEKTLSEACFLLTACRNLLLADDRASAVRTRHEVERFLRGVKSGAETSLGAGV